jgi:WD40 repeat protein
MSHPFGDLIWNHLIRRKGLSQNKLAMGINQDPAVIARMCNGKALTGPQSRERIVQIIEWLHEQGVLEFVEEANALLAAADKPGLSASLPKEAHLLQVLRLQQQHSTPVQSPTVAVSALPLVAEPELVHDAESKQEQGHEEERVPPKQERRPPPSPYRGLFAFREEDAHFFCGREVFSDRLAHIVQVQRKPLVAVIGPSGSGKSSVVFAGLVPRLRQTGTWVIESFRPGDRPFQALSAMLVPLLEPQMSETKRLIEVNEMAAAFTQGKLSLQQVVGRVIEKNASAESLLLIADQFEELYTLCRDAREREAFLDLLLGSVPGPKERSNGRGAHSPEMSVVLTLRADFLGPALAYRPMVDALQGADLKLGSMTREELQQAIEKPAAQLGVGIESGLTKRILDAVTDEPGNLPLLEFALTLLWARQSDGMLTHAAYDEIGGVDKALARYAEEVFSELTEEEQQRAKHIFIQLVQPGEATEDTRRLANREEVKQDNWNLVVELANARLVVSDRDDATGEDTIEIVHEALIRGWDRLREWINSDRTFRTWQERMRGALHQWENSDKDEGALLRGATLAEAEQWLAERRDDLGESEQNFIKASVDLREREQAAEKLRKEHELQLAREAAAAQKRAAVRLRYLALALTVFLLIAVVLSGWAINSTNIAQEKENEANTNEGLAKASAATAVANFEEAQAVRLADKAQLLDQGSPALTALLALRSVGIEQTSEGEAALDRAALFEYPSKVFQGHDSGVWGVAVSNDGKRLLAGSYDETAIMWDVATAKQLFILTDTVAVKQRGNGVSLKVWDVAISPDGQYALTAHTDGKLRLWDVSPSIDPATLAGPQVIAQPLRSFNTGSDQIRVLAAAFSPDGKYVAGGREDGEVRVWEISGRPVLTLSKHIESVQAVAFTPDGKSLVTGSRDKTINLWQLGDLREAKTVVTPTKTLTFPSAVTALSLSADGARVLVGGDDGMLQLWDLTGGSMIMEFKGHNGTVSGVAYWTDQASKQHYAVGASADGTVRLWDADRGELRRTLTGLKPRANRIVYSQAGQFVALAAEDNTAKLWDLKAASPSQQLVGHSGGLQSAVFSPDGRYVLTTSTDRTARLWDRQTGNPIFTFTGYNDQLTLGAFSPEGKYVVTGTGQKDHMARLWDISDKQNIHIAHDFTDHTDQVYAVAFSRDGKYLLTGSDDYTAILWSLEPGNYHLIRKLDQPKHLSWITSVAFAPDGTRAFTASADKYVRLWDVTSGNLLHTFNNSTAVLKVDISPDGKYFLAAGYDGVVRMWDAVNWKEGPDRLFRGHTDVTLSAVFSPDPGYKYVLTSSFDGTARLWDTHTGAQIRVLVGGQSALETAVFSPDSDNKYILTASDDGVARIWFRDFQLAVSDLCTRLHGLDFTDDQRKQYGIIGLDGRIDNSATCKR